MIYSKFHISVSTVTVAFICLATPLFAQFAYVVNNGSHNVSGYKINADGSLTALSNSPFPAGNQPTWIAVDPASKFAYVTNSADGSVSEYKINAGALVGNGTAFAGSQPTSVAVDRTGRCAYVTNAGSGSVSEYKIDASGTLTPIGSHNVGVNPDSIVAHPKKDQVFVVDKSTGKIYAFKSISCALSFDSSKGVGSQPVFVTVITGNTSTGNPHCLYVADKGSDKVAGYYTPDAVSGHLLGPRINGFPYGLPPGSQPQSVTELHLQPGPANWFAYVTDNGSNKVSGFVANTKCQPVKAISGSPFNTGHGPASLAIGPGGKFAYVANEGDDNIWEYQIDGHGSLTFSGSKVPAGAAPVAIVIH